MEKEIKITIEKDGETKEIQTNCAIIVADKEEAVKTMLLVRNCNSIELSEVVAGALSVVEDIYKKNPEVKLLVEFMKKMRSIMGDHNEDEEG